MKFLRPTNSPGLPTLMLDSENHTPITNGYAMKAPSRTTVGLRSANARSRSFSRRRSNARRCAVLGCESATSTRAALPAPPAIGFFKPMPCRSGFVDFLQLAFGPLHSLLGFHALDGLGVHVDDDVLRVGLGGLGRRWVRMPVGAREAGRFPVYLRGLVEWGPPRGVFAALGRPEPVTVVDRGAL